MLPAPFPCFRYGLLGRFIRPVTMDVHQYVNDFTSNHSPRVVNVANYLGCDKINFAIVVTMPFLPNPLENDHNPS